MSQTDAVLPPNARLGIYGGTFDPIHLGHLILARDALEQWELDAIFFIPCAQSPHKEAPVLATAAQRLALLRRGLRGEPRFRIDRRELERDAPSYSSETYRELRAIWPKASFTWLIGEDQLPRLTEWHHFSEFKDEVRWGLLERRSASESPSAPVPVLRLPNPRQIDISSTEIRARVKSHLPIDHLVPAAVAAYIRQHLLYVSRLE